MSKEFVALVAVTCSLTQNLILTHEQDVLASLSLLQVQYNFSQSCFGNLIFENVARNMTQKLSKTVIFYLILQYNYNIYLLMCTVLLHHTDDYSTRLDRLCCTLQFKTS